VFYLLETGSNVEHFLGDLAIVAGSETTTTAIKNVLFFLMTNLTAYKRLRAEIDELGDNIVDCAAQVHLPYLNAVM
jgi:cytochrome P450